VAVLRIDGAARAASAIGGLVAATARKRRRAGADPRLVRGAEFVALAVIAAFSAIVLLQVFSPMPDAPAAIVSAPAPQKLIAVKSPFGETALAAAPPSATATEAISETSLNLTLHGTWVDASGGVAIIKTSSGDQKRFARGDEIEAGVVLQEVRRDQVVISRGGVSETLTLENRDATVSATQLKTNSAAASFDGAGLASLGSGVRIVPRTDAIGAVRLTLTPGASPVIFERMGLQSGDVLIAIDGRDVGADIAQEVEAIGRLAGRASVDVTIEREGERIPVTLPLAAIQEELIR
jgi:type II secretion system protein C